MQNICPQLFLPFDTTLWSSTRRKVERWNVVIREMRLGANDDSTQPHKPVRVCECEKQLREGATMQRAARRMQQSVCDCVLPVTCSRVSLRVRQKATAKNHHRHTKTPLYSPLSHDDHSCYGAVAFGRDGFTFGPRMQLCTSSAAAPFAVPTTPLVPVPRRFHLSLHRFAAPGVSGGPRLDCRQSRSAAAAAAAPRRVSQARAHGALCKQRTSPRASSTSHHSFLRCLRLPRGFSRR